MSGRGEARPQQSTNPFQPWLDQNERERLHTQTTPAAAHQQQFLAQEHQQQFLQPGQEQQQQQQQQQGQQQFLQPAQELQAQQPPQAVQVPRIEFAPPPPRRNLTRSPGPPPPVPARTRPPPPPPPRPAKESPPPSYSELYAPLTQQPSRRYSHAGGEVGKLPPPRPQPPGRKLSEGNVPVAGGYKFNSKRGTNVILPPPIQTEFVQVKPEPDKINERQDSNISSDSFSQSSSPSYTVKSMEAPLLPGTQAGKKKKHGLEGGLAPIRLDKIKDGVVDGDPNTSPITKSHSTPASLQTIVRFHSGSNMSLHHRIIRDIRRPSNHYISSGRLRFQFAQVILNAIAILAIAGSLALYFKAYPTAVRYVNRTITTTKVSYVPTKEVNPAPGVCLPVIAQFCMQHKVPYNFTVFPNFIGHFNQREASQELEVYDAIVDVRCYENAALFLCTVFVPKCSPEGTPVRPCKSLCAETMRRCGFFLEVFGLTLPPYLDCDLFPESNDTDYCIGQREVIQAEERAQSPKCVVGFQCDAKRCIPDDWVCDGHIDCEDQSDELNCDSCAPGMVHCGANKCITSAHMCDGEVHCPWGQDERNCLRLSEKMGDEGQGKLEVFEPALKSWRPACVKNWNQETSANAICNFLGYAQSNSSHLSMKPNNFPGSTRSDMLRFPVVTSKRKRTSLLKELKNCPTQSFPTVDLTCKNILCGQRRVPPAVPSKRIIGGNVASPGDWPFLAALLGGPEQIFYCAGVLISDQWVLTASHCVGNFSHGNTSGWTIHLGISRRHAHSYFGQKAKVKRVVPHPLYNIGVAHDNDVALFQLQQKVTFHEHLLPVCLPKPNYELKPGTMCTVIGWGKREDTNWSEYEAAVNEVQVPVLNRSLCNKWLEPKDLNVTQGMICAGYEAGGKDACQGDSGGPLLCKSPDNMDRWFVGGIVSWGIKCAHPRLPGVYAYVPYYVPWIKEQMARFSE